MPSLELDSFSPHEVIADRSDMTHADIVNVLNALIRVTEDRRRGYSDGARAAAAPKLGTLLRVRSTQCESALFELKGLVRTLGGEPARHGTMYGTIHCAIARSMAVLGNSNIVALGEMWRLEERAAAAYAKALTAMLPHHVSCALRLQQYSAIRNTHLMHELHSCYRNMGDLISTAMLK